MRAFQILAVLAAVGANAAEHGSLRKQSPCDEACQVERAQGKVAAAEEALDKNIQASAATKKMIAYTASIKGDSDIAAREKAVGDETQAPALGKMLASMWGEMREYQSPFYEEHLSAQAVQLDDEHARLQVRLAKAHGELSYAKSKAKGKAPAPAEEAEEEEEVPPAKEEAEEVPPAKLAIKPNGKSLEMHSEEDDDDKDDDDDDNEQEKPKLQTLKAVKVQQQAEAEESAEAIADETEQEVDGAVVASATKTDADAPGKPWSNNGFAKGMEATSDQHAHFWKHGLSAGDPGRKGWYPADLSQPIPETPFTPKEVFGTKKVVEEAPEEPQPEPEPEAKPAPKKVSVKPVPAEADDDDDVEEAEAVKRVEAANKDAEDDDDEEDDEKEDGTGRPEKAVAGQGDMSDGMGETHKQFKKFLSGGFFNGDKREGLYPVDLAK